MRGELVPYIINRLMNLECGVYLLARHDTEIQRLMNLNALLRDLMNALVVHQDLRSIAQFLLEHARTVLPVSGVEFWARQGLEEALHFAPESRFRGVTEPIPPHPSIARLLERGGQAPDRIANHLVAVADGSRDLLVPLRTSEGMGSLRRRRPYPCSAALEVTDELDLVLGQLAQPLAVAIEREKLHRDLERERDRFYERSIRDVLTGLYTRRYLEDAGARMLAQHDRDENAPCAMVMLDVDHFKHVNDGHGHATGDALLRAIGETVRRVVRESDIAVRYGGEELAVLINARSDAAATSLAERIRSEVGKLAIPTPTRTSLSVTVSAGVALHRQSEGLAALIRRADEALYRAKETGRDRAVIAA